MTFEEWKAGEYLGLAEEEYARDAWNAATKAEREACAKLCDDERAEFIAKAGENNGRESDFAFGSVNSAERIGVAIRARSNVEGNRTPACGRSG